MFAFSEPFTCLSQAADESTEINQLCTTQKRKVVNKLAYYIAIFFRLLVQSCNKACNHLRHWATVSIVFVFCLVKVS